MARYHATLSPAPTPARRPDTIEQSRSSAEHIAMLCDGSEGYGVGTVVKLYAEGMPGMRFLCFREGPLWDWLRQNGHEVHLMHGLTGFWAGGSLATIMRLPGLMLQAREDTRRIDELLKRWNVTIVHTHWLSQQMMGVFLRRRGYRVVWHIHNNMNCERLFGWGVKLNHQLARWGADLIIPVSDFCAANYEGCGVPIRTVHNAARSVYRSANRLPASPFRCLVAGRLTHSKGQHISVDAVLAARRAGLDVRLDIFGGPVEGNPYADELRATIRRAGAEPYIRLMGFCPDLRQRHQAYHLGLQCRIDPEPCSMWICETLMDGLPLLASATGGTPELLEDGVTGILFRANDAGDLATKLIDLLHHPERLDAMRRISFMRSQVRLSVDRFLRETFEAYHLLERE